MNKTFGVLLLIAAASPSGLAQSISRPAPTAADWLAISKLPDFSGCGRSRSAPHGA